MIGFKPNDYVQPPKSEDELHDADFSRFREDRMNLQSTEVRDAFRRYNRHNRSL